jgi:hypothetical protein
MLVFCAWSEERELNNNKRWNMSYDNEKNYKKIKNKLELHR